MDNKIMTFVIDIDNTLLKSETIDCQFCNGAKYENVKAIQQEIDEVNKRFNNGDNIILYTGRSWSQYELTKKQLKQFRIKYHELMMGKPPGIWIDRDAFKSIKDFI